MRIRSLDVVQLQIPFEDGSAGVGLMPTKWNKLDVVLVRLETTDGVVGWGDGFAYVCRTATAAAIRDMLMPLVVGVEIEDIAAFNLHLQQRLHLHGRYGITMFAISAIDIALWDIAAKKAGQPLSGFIGGQERTSLPAYASLVRYGDPELVASYTNRAVDEGYGAVKLHEITLETIAAGRDGAGESAKLVTDVNCNWSLEEAKAIMPDMKRLDLYWVEEPVFPPDDAEVLSSLQETYGVAMASGENACTSVEFARTAGRIKFVQPSVIKVGGVTEFLKVCDIAGAQGSKVMPHAPYFGPGYWASVHLMASRDVCELFEHLYVWPEAYLDADIPLPADGQVNVPDKPGLGFEPDAEILRRYAV